MSDETPNLADREQERRRREDTALALPALGVLLLVSPLLNIVGGVKTILGMPASYVYIFAVWFFLILATARMARLLSSDPQD